MQDFPHAFAGTELFNNSEHLGDSLRVVGLDICGFADVVGEVVEFEVGLGGSGRLLVFGSLALFLRG